MQAPYQPFRWLIIIAGLTWNVAATARTFAVGPSAMYLISTSSPSQSSIQTQPTRYWVGGSASWMFSKGTEFRLGLGYRGEEGAVGTPESQLPEQSASIAVVDNQGSEPQMISTITASSLELDATLCFPVLKLDTSGAAVGVSIGLLADAILSAKQQDDYSAIPDHPAPDLVEAEFEQQLGFGAAVGAYVVVPFGSNRLSFDLNYVFRQPSTISTTTTPPVESEIGWVIGRGLRLGATFYIGL